MDNKFALFHVSNGFILRSTFDSLHHSQLDPLQDLAEWFKNKGIARFSVTPSPSLLHVLVPCAANLAFTRHGGPHRVRGSTPSYASQGLKGHTYCFSAVLAIGTSILNIGNPAFAGIPIGSRVMMALLQAAAVRSAGYVTVSPSAIAPASQ